MKDHIKFLNNLGNPIHILTKDDIKQCVNLWEQRNHPYMLLFSPFRWGRVASDTKTRSIRELSNLVTSWNNFNPNEPISDNDARLIAKIITDRAHRKSHSYRDLTGNSSTIFSALTRSRQILAHLPESDFPNTIPEICDKLTSLLQTPRYQSAISSGQHLRAQAYIRQIKTLEQEKTQAARELAAGRAYFGSNGLMLGLQGFRALNQTQATSIIEQFLQQFRQAVVYCAGHYALDHLFNQMGSFLFGCILGQSSGIIRLANKLEQDSQSTFATTHDLMEAIITELDIKDLDASEMKEKIMARYEGQTFGDFTITKNFVTSYLRTTFDSDLESDAEPEESAYKARRVR